MSVTVEVVGEGTREVDPEPGATYADLLRAVDLSPQEASVLVDGTPVPEDRPVEADAVRVLRLIKGGSGDAADREGSGGTDPAADPLDFELPNAGPGPDPFRLSDCEAELAVLLFHRDYLCGNCRKQVDAVADRHGEFRERGAEVVSVLPEPRGRAAEWVDEHDVPYPLLSDPDSAVADRYRQPVKFGALGRRVDLLGRMPQAVLVELRGDPTHLWEYAGRTPVDRPEVDDLLDRVDAFR